MKRLLTAQARLETREAEIARAIDPTTGRLGAKVETVGTLTILRWIDSSWVCVKIWSGSAAKPFAHYSFETPEAREAFILRAIEGDKARARLKAERTAQEAARKIALKTQLKPGVILSTSWG